MKYRDWILFSANADLPYMSHISLLSVRLPTVQYVIQHSASRAVNPVYLDRDAESIYELHVSGDAPQALHGAHISCWSLGNVALTSSLTEQVKNEECSGDPSSPLTENWWAVL